MSLASVSSSHNNCGLPSLAGLVLPPPAPISNTMLAPFPHAVNTFGNDDITPVSLLLAGLKV
jgi:hypothetical protein